MSSNKDRDAENLHDFIEHLGNMKFSGTLQVTFNHGALTSLSRKDEMDPEALHAFLHRPVTLRKPKVAEPSVRAENVEVPQETGTNAANA